tara:strand:+ start:57 stop:236 length:180 start_codon:yes stop_codon:yes gene_type:complete
MNKLKDLEFLGWPIDKVLDHIAHELGGEINYLITSNSNGFTSQKIVIEYDVKKQEETNA